MDEIQWSQLEWVRRCHPNQSRKDRDQRLGSGCQVHFEKRHSETVGGSWSDHPMGGIEQLEIRLHFPKIVDPFQDALLQHAE